MFLKTHRVRKGGKEHVYYSLGESLRISRSRVTQRTVLHLGEGRKGIRAAGFFGLDWSVDRGEIAWRG